MMLRQSVLCLSLITLPACENIAERGAEVYDEGVAKAEFFICEAQSIGSYQRNYGSDPARAKAWADLCSSRTAKAPLTTTQ